ncbi:DUF3093 domain-containing protein [Tessaracoccus flavescens]|uniref:DUF3093 domain-containing protein n=1 Tax=Tessaracoccus flavescens TaxID=399497 RepID=A0A1Q2D213_9ACTN|nr:DUF3093 domain-containing protein [Tessaracoccus flavescens]AQP52343.1 hypothetical protein BW733_17460 [Tessaracoccus flavescens]
MTYSERLHIPWWWLLVAVAFAASMAVAVTAYVKPSVGIAFSVLLIIGLVLALFAYSRTLVSVDARGLAAGRYRVEPEYIAGATALEGEAARNALGPEADHRAFLFTRPFLSSLVRVDLADAHDPHPYWLVSTRHPGELASAIEKVSRVA